MIVADVSQRAHSTRGKNRKRLAPTSKIECRHNFPQTSIAHFSQPISIHLFHLHPSSVKAHGCLIFPEPLLGCLEILPNAFILVRVSSLSRRELSLVAEEELEGRARGRLIPSIIQPALSCLLCLFACLSTYRSTDRLIFILSSPSIKAFLV